MPEELDRIEKTVSHGEPFKVSLQSSSGTGASWFWKASDPAITLVSEVSEPIGDSPGDPARKLFVFQAARPGTYLIQFELRRSWEKQVRKAVEVRVIVE